MRLPWLALLLGGTLSCAAAHAQVGIYATFDANQRSRSTAAVSSTSNWLYGPTIGLYDDFLHLGPLSLGTDVRGEFVHGSGYSSDTGLFGVRLALKPPVLPVKPYIEAFGGIAHTNVPGSSSSSNNPEYRIAGGIDFTILPRVDWRVVEIGGGSLLNYDAANQSNSILSISTGLALRLP